MAAATSCWPAPAQEQACCAGPPQRPGRRAADSRSIIDQEKAGALGVDLADINTTLSTVLAGTLCQRFHRSRRVKQVYVQARCALPHAAGGSRTTGMCATRAARWCRSPPSPTSNGSMGSPKLDALQRHRRGRDPGLGGGRRQLRRRHGRDGEARLRARRRLHRRMDGHFLSGAAVRQPGADALCDLDPGRLPLPRGAL